MKLVVKVLKQRYFRDIKRLQVVDSMQIIEPQKPNGAWKSLEELTKSDKREGMKRIYKKAEDIGGSG
jgi:hypothetical protein